MNAVKNDKGVTLIVTVMYVIAMTISVVIVTIVSAFFVTNIKTLRGLAENEAQFAKFDMFFLADVKDASELHIDGDKLVLGKDGVYNIYTFDTAGGIIYRNGVKVNDNIQEFDFNYGTNPTTQEKDVTNVVAVYIQTKDTTGGLGTPVTREYKIGRGY